MLRGQGATSGAAPRLGAPPSGPHSPPAPGALGRKARSVAHPQRRPPTRRIHMHVGGRPAPQLHLEGWRLPPPTSHLPPPASRLPPRARYAGKETYEAGDLSKEIGIRAKSKALECTPTLTLTLTLTPTLTLTLTATLTLNPNPNPDQALEFTGKGSYSFGDVSIELNKRRAEWVTGYLGEDPHPHPNPNPNQASRVGHGLPGQGVRVRRPHHQDGAP